jgi:hypothetical protein
MEHGTVPSMAYSIRVNRVITGTGMATYVATQLELLIRSMLWDQCGFDAV